MSQLRFLDAVQFLLHLQSHHEIQINDKIISYERGSTF